MKISEAEAVSVKLKEFEKQVSCWTGAHTCSQRRSYIPTPLTLEEGRTEKKALINSLSVLFLLTISRQRDVVLQACDEKKLKESKASTRGFAQESKSVHVTSCCIGGCVREIHRCPLIFKILAASTCYSYCIINSHPSPPVATFLCGLYRYVRPQRVWLFSRFSQKWGRENRRFSS